MCVCYRTASHIASYLRKSYKCSKYSGKILSNLTAHKFAWNFNRESVFVGFLFRIFSFFFFVSYLPTRKLFHSHTRTQTIEKTIQSKPWFWGTVSVSDFCRQSVIKPIGFSGSDERVQDEKVVLGANMCLCVCVFVFLSYLIHFVSYAVFDRTFIQNLPTLASKTTLAYFYVIFK